MSQLCYRGFCGSRNKRSLILGRAYYLDSFSSVLFRTWLPGFYPGHDSCYTRCVLSS
ncbi:unnamed protein product [Linum tenue]|uniref:Uncharacterized protein n=1 Tax=Linum tenue TaxID=586396 RepID=A0AAV0L5H8_9ROSI|nr:unnamed protein product [Linum tenue]